MRKLIIIAAALVAVTITSTAAFVPSAGAATGAIAPSAYATTSIDRGKLNYNTHRFISQARRCVSVVGLSGSPVNFTPAKLRPLTLALMIVP